MHLLTVLCIQRCAQTKLQSILFDRLNNKLWTYSAFMVDQQQVLACQLMHYDQIQLQCRRNVFQHQFNRIKQCTSGWLVSTYLSTNACLLAFPQETIKLSSFWFDLKLTTFCVVTVYVEYFTKAIIELVKVNTFLILQINADSRI